MAMHDCVTSAGRVVELFEGRVAFDGNVETFTGHLKASLAFAWAFDDGGEPCYLAVLNVPPINDPSDAVKAAISSGFFR